MLPTSLLLSAALSAATPADTSSPAVGAWGFDWLAPREARCEPVTEKNRKRFSGCGFEPQGRAFGLSLPFHRCRATRHSEFLVYRNRSDCQEALETMEANAP